MSATAASLSCPICAHTGVFDSVQSLRDRLIHVSTNKMLCPVCQDEVAGLDKLTIHLFSHVKLITAKRCPDKQISSVGISQSEKQVTLQQKKSRPTAAKNKSSSSAPSDPIKYVKIYPKLPIISLNTLPIIDIAQSSVEDCVQVASPAYVSATAMKTETSITQTNTTCNVCGLQFVDSSILKMHRCLIHNIDDNTSQSFTRYQCHICPKSFKMRGSLMVHLRVAHYGFISGNRISTIDGDKTDTEITSLKQDFEDKLSNLVRNDSKQWQCDVCRKCFTTKYFLKKHKRLHTGETPYACSQCNKTFTFQQSYHKHLLYHNDEKPHTCNYCGRAFKELSTLHNHQRIHTGEKPFSCETCGKCFRQRVSYLVHRRIHTGVMPYKCTACEKSFRYKVSQRTHKCASKPPGIVVRQTGDLVEKLKKKRTDSEKFDPPEQTSAKYLEISEANAELVRQGANLSLEDMESENFKLISENFNDTSIVNISNSVDSLKTTHVEAANSRNVALPQSNIEDLIDSIPIVDKSVPSPSDILKNLCLSNDDDYMDILQGRDTEKSFDLYKDFNGFM